MITKASNEWNQIAPKSFFYDDVIQDESRKSMMSTNIMKFYFESNRIGRESWANYSSIYTDRLYLAGIVESIMTQSSMMHIYPYQFKFKGDHSYSEMMYGSYDVRHGKSSFWFGLLDRLYILLTIQIVNHYYTAPSHFDELHYLFNWEWTREYQMKGATPYWDMSSKLVKLWASFAENGCVKIIIIILLNVILEMKLH